MALAAVGGTVALLVAVVIVQIIFCVGWFTMLDLPGRDLGIGLAVAAGFAADLAMLERAGDISLGPLAGVLGPALGAALILQFLRVGTRDRLTAGLTATVMAVSLSVFAAALVAEREATEGEAVTVVAVLAAGVAASVLAAGLPAAAADLLAVALAVGVGVGAGALIGGMDLAYVLAVAFAAAVLAVLARRTVDYALYDLASPPVEVGAPTGGRAAARTARRAATRAARRSGEAALMLNSALPLVFAAPASYVLGRLLVG
ncbi:MAG: hypothetical protein ACT4P1_09480 [Sporichthyaceae bacterium]